MINWRTFCILTARINWAWIDTSSVQSIAQFRRWTVIVILTNRLISINYCKKTNLNFWFQMLWQATLVLPGSHKTKPLPANPSMQLQSLPWFTLIQAAFKAHGFRASQGWRQTPSKQNSAKEQSSLRVHWTVCVYVLGFFICSVRMWKRKQNNLICNWWYLQKICLWYNVYNVFLCHVLWKCQQLYGVVDGSSCVTPNNNDRYNKIKKQPSIQQIYK